MVDMRVGGCVGTLLLHLLATDVDVFLFLEGG
jgi:hypothetical protein